MTLRPAISHRGSAAFVKGLFYDKRPKVRTVARPSGWTDAFEDMQRWELLIRLRK